MRDKKLCSQKGIVACSKIRTVSMSLQSKVPPMQDCGVGVGFDGVRVGVGVDKNSLNKTPNRLL